MRRLFAAAVLTATLAQSAQAQVVACDVKLNVIDQDPAGLNVRASPGGAVVGALKARGRWVQVHVTGASAQWARIDDAAVVSEESGAARPLHPTTGWVAFSKLGFEMFDSGARIRAASSDDAKTVLQMEGSSETDARTAIVFGCSGFFLNMQFKGVNGWTRNFCSSRLTTCV